MAAESRDPTNDDSLLGCFREVLRKFLQTTDDMLPAVVETYNRSSNMVRVRPSIQLVDTEGNTIDRAPLDIPVLVAGAGGFIISFHIPPGSRGWIKASDRDLTLYRQSLTISRPNTRRMHTFEDAVFIPDVMRGFTVADADSESMVIQSTAGAVKISLNDSRIDINAPAINLTATGAVAITSASLTHNGTNIGDDHIHPQEPDSANNTEQDTGGPK